MTAVTNDNSPPRPQLAVSAAIFRGPEVLLVRRAHAPAKGRYSLPGGRVEFGESLAQALIREVAEETGLSIEIVAIAGWREILPDVAADQSGHFVILPFAARWRSGDVVLNDELDDARWLTPDQIGELDTTDGLQDIVRSAQALL